KHGSKGGLAVGSGDAEMQRRALRRLHTHHFHWTLGVRPRAISGQGKFDLRGKTLCALRELDRWPRMKTDFVDENRRGDQRCRLFASPAGVGIMHRIPPRYA